MDLSEKIKARLEQTNPRAFEGASSRGIRLEQTNPRAFEGATGKGIVYPQLSWEIVGAAIEVHRHIGPGHLESVYQRSMVCELRRRGLGVRAQVPVPMFFKGEPVGDFFTDLIVEDAVILELKAVERLKGVHTAQLLSYLHAANLRLGMLLNFNVSRMVQGVQRVVR